MIFAYYATPLVFVDSHVYADYNSVSKHLYQKTLEPYGANYRAKPVMIAPQNYNHAGTGVTVVVDEDSMRRSFIDDTAFMTWLQWHLE